MIKNWTKTIFAAALVAAIALPAITMASQQHYPAHMPMLKRTSQPIGHANFCSQYPSECNQRSNSASSPQLTRKRWADLVEINALANTSVVQVTDMELYRVEEHWAYPDRYGDCEDFVLLKRAMLIKRGWPVSALLITVVRQQNGDGHAVLTAHTDHGDYILDNMTDRILQWSDTKYRYLKRQSQRHSGRWTDIADSRSL